MATFIATTASNGPKLRDPEGARRVLDRYYLEGEVEARFDADESTGEARLAIYGYDWPSALRIPDGVSREEFEPDYDSDPAEEFEQLLLELAPYLAEPLTVHAVGSEKCRYPLSACEWHIRPGATEIEVNGFKHSCDEPITVAEEPGVIPS